MFRTSARIAWRTAALIAASFAIAVTTNALRSDGIPLVAEVEYDIFSQCEDSDIKSQAASTSEIAAKDSGVLYVDARPAELFAKSRVAGAISAPYSVLFGADPASVAAVKAEAARRSAKEVIVYGLIPGTGEGEPPVDVAKPLAEQLLESGVASAKHIEGGIDALKKLGVDVVEGQGGNR